MKIYNDLTMLCALWNQLVLDSGQWIKSILFFMFLDVVFSNWINIDIKLVQSYDSKATLKSFINLKLSFIIRMSKFQWTTRFLSKQGLWATSHKFFVFCQNDAFEWGEMTLFSIHFWSMFLVCHPHLSCPLKTP